MILANRLRMVSDISPGQGDDGVDPYWDNVVLLMEASGMPTTTTFTDYSLSAHSPIAYANAQIGTGWIGSSDATFSLTAPGDLIQIPYSDDFIFGSDDFTMECWVKITTNIDHSPIFVAATSGHLTATNYRVEYSSARGIWIAGNGGLSLTASYPANTDWHHIAVVKNSNTLSVFIDGVLYATGQSTRTFNTASDFVIGGYFPGNVSTIIGDINKIRITKGVARYTTNFTPSTGPFPNTGP